MLESSPGNSFSQSFDDLQDLTDLRPQAHGMSAVPQRVEGAPGRADGEEAHYQHSCSSDDIVFEGNDNHDENLIQRLHRQLAEAEERIKVLSEEVSVERLAQKKPQRAVDMALVLSPRTISTTDVEVLRQRVLQLQVENREREAEVDQLHLLLLELRPKLESEVRDQVADIISKAEKDAREIRLQAGTCFSSTNVLAFLVQKYLRRSSRELVLNLLALLVLSSAGSVTLRASRCGTAGEPRQNRKRTEYGALLLRHYFYFCNSKASKLSCCSFRSRSCSEESRN
jgi:hypothetical protein